MASLAEICREAAGAVPPHPPHIRCRIESNERVLRLERNPSADELMDVEEHLQLGADVGGVRDSDLDASAFDRALREHAWGFMEPSESVITVTIMPMTNPRAAISSRVVVGSLADFLNDVAYATMNAGLDDMQFLLGEASGGGADDIISVSGLVIDIDTTVPDPTEHHLVHQARVPAVVFPTEHGGARLIYPFEADHPLTPELERRREQLWDQLMLTYPGVDPKCRSVLQRQYLPMVWRTTKGPRRQVMQQAIQLTDERVELLKVQPDAPYALLDALDLVSVGVTAVERVDVETYLESIGTPAPPLGAPSLLYSRCPLKAHRSRKSYVNRHRDGRVSVHCLGGHEGAGSRHWSEQELLLLARGAA